MTDQFTYNSTGYRQAMRWLETIGRLDEVLNNSLLSNSTFITYEANLIYRSQHPQNYSIPIHAPKYRARKTA